VDINRLSIGVADSIYSDDDFDPEKTLKWAEKNNFSPVQIFLNLERIQSPSRIVELNKMAINSGITLIAHAPGFALFDPAERDRVFDVAHRLLEGTAGLFGKKHLVWHIDPDCSVKDNLELHHSINHAHLVSAPENYLKILTEVHLRKCMRILETLWSQELVVPVPDLPRFFSFDSDECLINALTALQISSQNQRVVLHVIDGVLPLINRDGWCAPGKGICEWDYVWPAVCESLKEFCIVLEYEDRVNPLKARDWFQKE